METLGSRIRSLRDQHDLSLREFARKLEGVTAAHISDIENGRRNPSPELLHKMAKALVVPVEELEKLGTGLPLEELRDAVRREPALGFALRRVAEEGISAEELLKLTRDRKGGTSK
ncbi:MAG: helix-turn-helix domain-containing protein [Bryobacteraceae bacterium]|jgi:transcriptional regulator with XRE-family HTH domain|nr:helix-turn-helix transcriptional regulator [Solibacteraceae bacterium]MBN8728909.1 helix-turn-helix transcriptional regulator [Acidobacteriota bacterium]MCO5349950.1 helix-turn-helix domain-containing protein [Bryobacteraceae bacterium]MCZ2076221.1 helix-turn-helix domain-containing protein [Bryobacterales bacterium]